MAAIALFSACGGDGSSTQGPPVPGEDTEPVGAAPAETARLGPATVVPPESPEGAPLDPAPEPPVAAPTEPSAVPEPPVEPEPPVGPMPPVEPEPPEPEEMGPSEEQLLRGMWSTVQAEGAPSERHECGFAEVGGKLYLVGGRGRKATDVFDPATSTWTQAAGPPIELHHFQPVGYLGKLYVAVAFGDLILGASDPNAHRSATFVTEQPAVCAFVSAKSSSS